MHINENVNFNPYLTTCTKINDLSEIINLNIKSKFIKLSGMKYSLPGGKRRYFRAQQVRFIKEK